MDFKNLLSQLDQLNEATKETTTGKVHTAEPGGYGRKDDEDDEGKKVKADTPKKGRGRPKKDADTHGNDTPKPDWSQFGVNKGAKLPAWDKKKTTKHSIKEWIQEIEDKYIAEAEQIQIKPASQMPKTPGQTSLPGQTGQPPVAGQQQQVAGQPPKNTQVIAQGNKTLGTVDNPQLAQQIKQSIGKGEMTLMPNGEEQMAEAGYSAKAARAGKDIGKPGKQFAKIAKSAGEKYGSKERGEKVAGAVLAKLRGKATEGAHTQGYAELNPAPKKPGLGGKLANVAKKIGSAITGPGDEELLDRLAKSSGGKRPARQVKEGDIPSASGVDTLGAGLGSGRSQRTLEGKKPDFLDLDKDGNKKESMKKAAQDKKKVAEGKMSELDADLKDTSFSDAEFKKKYGKSKAEKRESMKPKKAVKEGLSQRLQAARLDGKSHGLKGHQHCGNNYDDMEEARHYHEGYKEGLDECYGQGPTVMDELAAPAVPPATTSGMASAATPAVGEGNAFSAGLAKTPRGGKFSLGGRTFTDRTSYDAPTFESLDKQLNALLESEKVEEGMTVSISKGQQGSPDSVTVSAQDGEADQLLSLIKQAGLGLFGGDDQNGYGAPQGSDMAHDHDGINVVDDHDGMMALMKKLTGQGGDEGSEDYADEEEGQADSAEEETCDACGSSDCQCGSGEEEEVVDEVESYDQEEEEVAEENAPDSGAAETTSDENAEAQEDSALAVADAGQDAEEGKEDAAEEEQQVTEWANDAADDEDESFKTDIDFMTNVISGGLNKQKATGQSTIPVVASQASRLGNPMQESINLLSDWKKLSGIK